MLQFSVSLFFNLALLRSPLIVFDISDTFARSQEISKDWGILNL